MLTSFFYLFFLDFTAFIKFGMTHVSKKNAKYPLSI
jgi:hypothetical protein